MDVECGGSKIRFFEMKDVSKGLRLTIGEACIECHILYRWHRLQESGWKAVVFYKAAAV